MKELYVLHRYGNPDAWGRGTLFDVLRMGLSRLTPRERADLRLALEAMCQADVAGIGRHGAARRA